MPDQLRGTAGSLEVTVMVGGRPSRRVADLSVMGPTADVFAVTVDAAGVAHVVFGNGVHGRRPPAGAAISVAYRSSGAAGSVGSVAPLAAGASSFALQIPTRPATVVVRAAPRRWPPL
jgi:hypothetical protein